MLRIDTLIGKTRTDSTFRRSITRRRAEAMSGMQSFVKGNRNGQAGSPQNGPAPVNPIRKAVAANLRVPMKAHVARPPTAIGLHMRGESTTQHQVISPPRQQSQPLQRRPSGDSRKHDPWDTDGESIDTTINDSVVQVEGSQQHNKQQLQPHNEQSEAGGDENVESEELDDEGAGYGSEVDAYLTQNGFADAAEEVRMAFLQRSQPQLFATVDGDSYPTTTDGNPTEWDEQQDSRIQDLGTPSLSPEPRPQGLNAVLPNSHSLQATISNVPRASSDVPQTTRIWQQGAQLRGQQRYDSAARNREGAVELQNVEHPSASQPPTYSQATDGNRPAAPLIARVEGIVLENQTSGPQQFTMTPPGQGHVHNSTSRIVEPAHTLLQAPTRRAQVVPVIQQHVEPALTGEAVDYDQNALASMSYDYLRDESFDKDPGERDPILPKNMREKPLPERLHFVQREFDHIKQSEFFSALSTNEWEDAGDWFLDQFSVIIKRTKEARQNKRLAAQGFEHDIELRHRHVAKKQRLVEDAMAKMQAQGEGLVPKSPRPGRG